MSSAARHLSLSIEHRIYQILLERGWTMLRDDVPLMPDGDLYKLDGQERPLVFTDTGYRAWADGLEIFEDGTTVDPADYTVHYFTHRIEFHRAVTGTLTANVIEYAADVIDGYPDDEQLEATDLPLIAYTIESDNDVGGYAIGTHYSWEATDVTIDVFASNKAQRRDLAYHLRHDIRYLPLLTYGDNQPRLSVGGLDPDFDPSTQFVTLARWRRRPGSDMLPPRRGGSEKERYRAMISLELQKVG